MVCFAVARSPIVCAQRSSTRRAAAPKNEIPKRVAEPEPQVPAAGISGVKDLLCEQLRAVVPALPLPEPLQRALHLRPGPAPIHKSAAAPEASPQVTIKLPRRLSERFAMALQAQCLPWAESEATLRTLWHEDCTFRDPVMQCRNREEFIGYLAMMAKNGKTLRVDVEHLSMNGNEGLATGRLYYKLNNGPDMAVDYSTLIIFKDGRVIEHRDYWDVASTIASAIMGKGKLPE